MSEAMLKCKECGGSIETSHKFCRKCGAKQLHPGADNGGVVSSEPPEPPAEDSLMALRAKARTGDTAAMFELCILHGCAGQHKTSYRLLRLVALTGDVRAQAALGTLLMEGIGCEVNEREGREWLDRAASQGYAPARLQQTISNNLLAGRKKALAARRRRTAAETDKAVPLSWEDYL
jgi:TPR repeat protein